MFRKILSTPHDTASAQSTVDLIDLAAPRTSHPLYALCTLDSVLLHETRVRDLLHLELDGEYAQHSEHAA